MSENTEKAKDTKKQKVLWGAIIAGLAVAIVLVAVFLLVPKAADGGDVSDLDFEDATWPQRLMENSVELYGKDLPMNSAYYYSNDGSSLLVVYATQTDIPDIRAYYAEEYGLNETGTNNEGSISMQGTVDGKDVTVKNYQSDVSNIIEVEIDYSDEKLAQRVQNAYPADVVKGIAHIADILGEETAQGYVMYNHDEYATENYPDVPQYSRLYSYNGSAEDLQQALDGLKAQYPEEADAVFFDGGVVLKDSGHLISLDIVENDKGVFCAVTVQQIPEKSTE